MSAASLTSSGGIGPAIGGVSATHAENTLLSPTFLNTYTHAYSSSPPVADVFRFCSSLKSFLLLAGPIPLELGNLGELEMLVLYDNQLTGVSYFREGRSNVLSCTHA